MNIVRVQGTLLRDPTEREVSGVTLCEFTVVVNGVGFDREHSTSVIKPVFVACQAWDYVAREFSAMGVTQGDEVHVVGSLTQSEITRRDGSKERKTRVEVSTVSIVRLSRRRSENPPW